MSTTTQARILEQRRRLERRQGRLATLLARVLARLEGRDLGRLFRYAATSVICLAVSEAVVLYLQDATTLGPISAALIANVAGGIPSYLLSRYWIWPEADRRRVGRQFVLYWAISFVSMGLSSFTYGVVADHVPHERIVHIVLLGVAYLVISLVLWVAKYVSYRSFCFTPKTRTRPADAL